MKKRIFKKMVAVLLAAVVAVGSVGVVPVEADEKDTDYDLEDFYGDCSLWRNVPDGIDGHKIDYISLPKCACYAEIEIESAYANFPFPLVSGTDHPEWEPLVNGTIEEANMYFDQARKFISLDNMDVWYGADGAVYLRIYFKGFDTRFVAAVKKGIDKYKICGYDDSDYIITDEYIDVRGYNESFGVSVPLGVEATDISTYIEDENRYLGWFLNFAFRMTISFNKIPHDEYEELYSKYGVPYPDGSGIMLPDDLDLEAYKAKPDLDRDRYFGDSDFDGKVDAIDALNVLRAVVHLDKMTLNDMAACDMDGDGSCDAGDALAILRTVVGLRDSVLIEEPIYQF